MVATNTAPSHDRRFVVSVIIIIIITTIIIIIIIIVKLIAINIKLQCSN
jgi:hypothetical protein